MDLSACSERASLNSPLKLAASSFALLAWVTIPKNWPQFTFLVLQYVPLLISSLSASTSLLSLRFFSLLSFLPYIFLLSLFTSPLILLSAECAFQIGNNFNRCSPPPRQRWRGPWRRASWAARRTSWPTPGLAGQCPQPLSRAFLPFPNKLTSIWNTAGTCH